MEGKDAEFVRMQCFVYSVQFLPLFQPSEIDLKTKYWMHSCLFFFLFVTRACLCQNKWILVCINIGHVLFYGIILKPTIYAFELSWKLTNVPTELNCGKIPLWLFTISLYVMFWPFLLCLCLGLHWYIHMQYKHV